MREFSTSAGHVTGACNCKQCGGSDARDGGSESGDALDEAALNRLIDEYGAEAVADALRDIRDGEDDDVSGAGSGGGVDVEGYMGRLGALQSLAENSDTDGQQGYTSYEDIAAAGSKGEGYMDRPGALQSLRDEPESNAVYSPYTDRETDADDADVGEGDDGEVAGYDIGGVLDSLKSDDE